jgi:protein involved in polysaccharide export with SLBB domain
MTIVLSTMSGAVSIDSLSPAQLQMIKQAGYGDYLKKLKADSAKTKDDVEKEQVVKNDIEDKRTTQEKQNISNHDKTEEKISNNVGFDFSKNSININQKLEKYGSSFFKNKNTLNPYSIPTPDNYILTRGDKISIAVYGIDNGDFETKVDRSGAVSIDKVGVIKVAGLKYEEVKKLLEQKIRNAFPTSTDIVVNISEFTPIQVMISGLVKAPGLYNLTSFSTIKDALLQTGGILENGSYRDIVLKRNGKVIKHFDLYQLIRYGDSSSDMLLQNGDIIVITPAKKLVKLYGAVNVPAIYELKDNENFISLIKFASGLKPNGDQHNVRLKRYLNNRKIKVSSIALVTLYKMLPKDGDEVTVFEISPQMAKSVTLEGNVAVNGEVELPKDHRLSTLFKKQFHKFGKKGFFKFNTDFSFGLVIYSDHIKSFNLNDVIKGYADVKLYGGEKIHIFKRSEIKPKEYVFALGNIVNPENRKYKFVNGMSIRDLFYLVDFKRIKKDDEKLNNNEKDIYTPGPKVVISRVENGKKKTYTVDIRKNPNFKLQPFD